MSNNRIDGISPAMPSANAIVNTRGADGFDNALIVGYACNCSFDPPMVMVGIVPSRYSHELITQNPNFVVQFARPDQKDEWKYLGSNSGRDEHKLEALGFEVRDADEVDAPIIADFPIAIECEVVDSIMTGSHEMFAGEIKAIHAADDFIDEDDNLAMGNGDLI